jgi:hypothetical protein
MKARRITATPVILFPSPPCDFTFPRRLNIQECDILPRNLLDNSRTEPPNELLKTKDHEKKDVKNEGSSQ